MTREGTPLGQRPETSGEDLTGKTGHTLKLDTGKVKLSTVATALPFAVLIEEGVLDTKVQTLRFGSADGTVFLRAEGAVTKGGLGVPGATDKSKTKAIATSGGGTEVAYCRFLEDGVDGQLVEAELFMPRTETIPA